LPPTGRTADRPPRVLVIDDDEDVRAGVREFLRERGYLVEEAEDCAQAASAFARAAPDVALLDERLPDGSGVELLGRLLVLAPSVPIVMLTGNASIELAVRAIKLGAEQFLTKPVDLEALRVILGRLIGSRRDRRKRLASEHRAEREGADPFIGTSPVIVRLREEAQRVLEAERPILIQGETGAGKSVLARWLHENGPRSREEFVDLNCASLSRELLESELFGHEQGAFTGAVRRKTGLLEVADRGTLFLDELGDMDISIQPRLLRVLEERRFRRLGDVRDIHVDVLLIAATHQDLGGLIRERRFREDLYYRLSVMPLHTPPLRERTEDIPELARVLLRRFAQERGRPDVSLADDAVTALKAYPWPGNVRELRNVLERGLLVSREDRIHAADLRLGAGRLVGPEAVEDEDQTLAGLERRQIQAVLRGTGGNLKAAASRLGISASSLYERIRRFGIPRSSS
jgi:DNA-binding NtrC family response regulator